MRTHRAIQRATWSRAASLVAASLLGATIAGTLPAVANAQGRVQIEVVGHYTHDVENGGEEWTFEVSAKDVPDLDGVGRVRLKNTKDGDSSPNFLASRNIADRMLFDHTYDRRLPKWIYIEQRGWENDRGDRRTFDCCSFWKNDDDDYRTGAAFLLVQGLESGRATTFHFPSLQGGEGRKHGLQLRLTVTR